MNDKDQIEKDAVQRTPVIVDLGPVKELTGHDGHGNRSDGGGTSSKYKDPDGGAGE